MLELEALDEINVRQYWFPDTPTFAKGWRKRKISCSDYQYHIDELVNDKCPCHFIPNQPTGQFPTRYPAASGGPPQGPLRLSHRAPSPVGASVRQDSTPHTIWIKATFISCCRHFKPGGEIRVKCLGTIAAEFWEDDVENVYTKVGPLLPILQGGQANVAVQSDLGLVHLH